MVVETEGMIYSLRGYCDKYHLPYDTINAYRANHKELSTMEALRAWKKMKESQNRRKEFCRKYDISLSTYINKLKIMTEEELAEEIKENKIFYNNQYINLKKYCRLNSLNYETLASKAQREKKTIKEMLLNASV